MYKVTFTIIGILGLIFIVLVILSCCKVSSDCERGSEEWYREDRNDDGGRA